MLQNLKAIGQLESYKDTKHWIGKTEYDAVGAVWSQQFIAVWIMNDDVIGVIMLGLYYTENS